LKPCLPRAAYAAGSFCCLYEEQRKKLTCPLCKYTFPNNEFYDSHHVIEARRIVDMLDEEFPTFIDTIAKIDTKKKEEKDIERRIEFIKETMQREAKFRQEQQQSEIKFIEEGQRRRV
jgi:hypothetical protein